MPIFQSFFVLQLLLCASSDITASPTRTNTKPRITTVTSSKDTLTSLGDTDTDSLSSDTADPVSKAATSACIDLSSANSGPSNDAEEEPVLISEGPTGAGCFLDTAEDQDAA
ncbi:hypothetical protein VKT23_020488 [Stygiomarasmius scandens]|uniref:Uncharacterized protein n=1 Tax=Marasmiellus scandens TaxID=2682957 RepID=A0ABR1IIZ6_9AGAR